MTITEANSGRRNDGALQQHLAPSRLGQATAVEQSRAIAEVQAAIVVAQQCPRNVSQASSNPTAAQSWAGTATRSPLPRGRQVVPGRRSPGPRRRPVWGNIQWGCRATP